MSKLEELQSMLDMFEQEIKPGMPEFRDLLRSIGRELKPLAEELSDEVVDLRARMIKRLTRRHGFTISEAISITNSLNNTIKSALDAKMLE